MALVVFLYGTSMASAQPNVATVLRGRIGIEERLDGPAITLDSLARARVTTANLPVFVRLTVTWTALQRAATGDWSALDARLDAYASRSVPVLLSIAQTNAPAVDTDWVPVIQAVASHLRGRVAGYQIEATSGADLPSPRDYAFHLKLAAVQIRAADPDVVIGQATATAANLAWLTAVYAEGTAAYVDLAPITAPGEPRDLQAAPEAEALIAANDPSAARLGIGAALGDVPEPGVERLLIAVLGQIGEGTIIGSTFTGAVDALAPALEAASQLKDVITSELIVMDDATVSLTIEASGRQVTALVPHRVLYNVSTGGMYLAYWGADAFGAQLTFTLVDRSNRAPMARDAARHEAAAVQAFAWDAATRVSRITARSSGPPIVLDFHDGSSTGVASRTEVTAAAALSVEEIVARHQRAQTAQANSFVTFMATLQTQIHFRASPTLVFDVVSDNAFFFGRGAPEWEERSFSVNGTSWGSDHPGLPLLQAEKVLTLPFDLRLTTDYRYRLEGTGTVGERFCYIVAFEPSDATRSRYRGRVWIDATTFLRARVQSIQTHLEGPIVSNEETTEYDPVLTRDGTAIMLATRVSAKQILLIAGRNLLLEKEQRFSDFRVDAPEFEAERQAARASRHVMFRDTDIGVRHLVMRDGVRVVSDHITSSSKAIAMGTTIDPTFAFPLPILGLNYLNFDLRGTGSQMALLFGGVFALGNVQTPKLGRTPFDASLDFFGIAVPGTDLLFTEDGEQKGERVLTIPMSTGANVGYQITPFQRVAVGYTLRFDTYFHAPETDPDFTIPSHTATHGATVSYEYNRAGYRLGGSTSAFVRSSWKNWGPPGDLHAGGASYRRTSLGVTKDFLFGPFQTVHVAGSWHGGVGLDRFSMYQFGLFDELRMHGVPSSGIRFPELAMIRGSYSFNVFGIYRLDLFIDQALGRDPVSRSVWRHVTGSGAAVTLKMPWNTMFTADIGKARMPAVYRDAGSVVLQLMLLKPL